MDDIEQLAGEEAFNAQIAKAQEQYQIKSLKVVTDTQLTEANATLRRIEHFLSTASTPFVGSFQSGGPVMQTGMALVHRGETVVPAGASPTISLTQHISLPPGASPNMGREIGRLAWEYIEQEARLRKIPLDLKKR